MSWFLSAGVLVFSWSTTSSDLREILAVVAYGPLPGLVFLVLGATAITSEKEAGTLHPLLLSPLGPWRIVSSKYAGVLIQGLPMFVAPLVHGLVEGKPVYLYGLVSSILVCAYLGATALLCSVLFRRMTTAIVSSVVSLLIQMVCSCNLITGLVIALPATLMGMGQRGIPRWDDMIILGVSALGYLLVLGVNLILAVSFFEPQARKLV